MRSKVIAVCLFCALGARIGADSLWDPRFTGIAGGSASLKTGDIVLVVLDGKTSLNVTSGRIDSKRVSLTMSNGEAGDLFSFLPSANSLGNMSFKGNENISLVARIATRVETVTGSDAVFVKGSRVFSIDGAESSIRISGWVRQRDLNAAGEVPIEKVADAVIQYDTAAAPSKEVLREEDLLSGTSPTSRGGGTIQGTETGTVQPGAEGTVQPAVEATQRNEGSVSLSPEKKRELLRTYINNFIELLF